MSISVRHRLLAMLVLGLVARGGLACTDRSTMDDDVGEQNPSGGDDAGDQPLTPGSMYSPCEASPECAPQEFCVFPQDESGYCTSACNAPSDPSNCDLPPGSQDLTCFDIGLDDGRWACALECASAPCPRGMRCEAVATADGDRLICF